VPVLPTRSLTTCVRVLCAVRGLSNPNLYSLESYSQPGSFVQL
jgi:hypothetical protein